jgi:protein-S-isoprenylcysteine O-methyltransferase Ste14
MALVVAAAIFGHPWPESVVLVLFGGALIALGALQMIWGGRTLGRALTPSPGPRGFHLERGPFRYVRHPMYGGGLLVASGVAFATSPLALVPTLVLVPFLLFKARYEERLLSRLDPGYGDYLERVRRRFIPWIF